MVGAVDFTYGLSYRLIIERVQPLSEKSFQEFMTEASASGLLEIEGAKIDVALGLVRLMERNKVSRKELAQRLRVSLPMVTKILRGDTNLTIETIVRAARAAGGRLHIELLGTDETAPTPHDSP